MARFRATIKGTRGEASRLGHKHISARVNGWELGVAVDGGAYGDSDRDAFSVYATSGSNGRHSNRFIGTILDDPEKGPVFIPAAQ